MKELTLEDVGVPVVEGKEETPAVKFEVIRDAEESSDEAPAKAPAKAAPAGEKKHLHRSHRHRDEAEKKEASEKEAAPEKKDDGSVKERKHRHHHH